jgi:hypothetical protein
LRLERGRNQRGLADVQYARVDVDSQLATVNPNIVGYVGGYYQWDNNWKLLGRVGVQSFGGAQRLNLTPFQPFTQPVVRVDLDRMDHNHNRLFGVTAQIAWVPKPSYQLTIRTPLYAVRNWRPSRNVLPRRANHRHMFNIPRMKPAPGSRSRAF